MKKRLLSVFTAVITTAASTLSVFPAVLTARADDITGETSDGFTYQITDSDVSITGWTGDKKTVASLVIPDTVDGKAVTRLESHSFEDFTSLTEITIPNTVTSFGWQVFSNTAVSSIDLPPEMEHLGTLIFSGCTNLKELTIPAGTSKSCIDSANYYGMGLLNSLMDSSIETVILEDGIGYVPDRLLQNCDSVKRIVIPDSVTTIGTAAFQWCDSMTAIDIPDSVTTIEYQAFYGNGGITGLHLPDSLEKIESEAFSESSIASVNLPSGLKEIGNYAFSECADLKEITIPASLTKGFQIFKDSGLETVTFEDGMEVIPDYLCEDAVNLTSVNIPASVTNLGRSSFEGTTSLKEFTVQKQMTEGVRAFFRSGIETVTFEEGLTKVPDDMFSSASSLRIINWASSLTEIGDSSFKDCSSLDVLDIPGNIRTIGCQAFYGCNSLKDLYIPDTVENVGYEAFAYCEGMENVRLPENGSKFDDYVFYRDPSIKSVYIPDGIVQSNGEPSANLFVDCQGLESVAFADSMKKIPNGVVQECSDLKEIRFPTELETIGNSSFANCTSLLHIDLPDTVKTIENNAFNGCTLLTDVVLPDGIETLNWGAFSKTYNLRSIRIPASLTTSDSAFEESCITEAWLDEGMENVPDTILDKCYNLETVHIPGSVKYIGDRAFRYCYNLRDLDMPFKNGDLMPAENYAGSAFSECNSLDDERVNLYDSRNTFINRTEVSEGENGILNYTIYCAPNPVHSAKNFSSGKVSVSVDGSNPIAGESLPAGLRPEEQTVRTSVRFDFNGDAKGMQVFRFSTSPKENANTEVSVYYTLYYDNQDFSMRIPVTGNTVPFGKLTLNVPGYVSVNDGTASIDLKGTFYGEGDVTIFVNGEEAAAVTPNIYSGRYFTHLDIPASAGDTLKIYASSPNGETTTVQNAVCRDYRTELEKIVFFHNNDHKGYTLDITDAVKKGTKPYIAYNPSRPVGFEVTLSDNNCEAVFVTSATSDRASAIELFFNEETGTWKGEGYFRSYIPGVLNVLAIRDDYTYMMELDSGGNGGKPSLKLGGVDLLAETPDNEPDLARDFIKEADISTIAYDSNGILLRYQYEVNGEKGDTGCFTGKSNTVVLDGKEITADAVSEDPEKYGFVRSPAQAVDENGNIHTYYVKFIVDEDPLKELADNLFIEEEDMSSASVSSLPGVVRSGKKSGTLSQYVRVNQDELASYVSGSVIVDKVQQTVTGESKSDFVTTVVTEAGKSGISTYLDSRGMGAAGETAGNAMTVAEVGVRTIGWYGEMKAINESQNPRVKENKFFLLGCSSCIFASRVGSIVVGGAIVAGTVGGAAAGTLAGGPCIIAGAVVIGGVVAVNKTIDAVHNWFKPLFAGEARMTGNGFELEYLIDPSGIAYEFLPSNPVEGAKAEIYYKDADGKEVLWNAIDFDQENPQITDSAGWFAWDVPEGEWQVRVSKDGYEDAASEWLNVLPVQTDVNLDMRSILTPGIAEATFVHGTATVRFTRHMLDESITADSIYLTDAEGNKISAVIKPVKESSNNTDSSIVYKLRTESDQLNGVSINVTPDAKSYAGIAAVKSALVLQEGTDTEEKNVVLGDVNLDGNVDASDASKVLEEYSNLSTGEASSFTEEQKIAGDVNFDGTTDSSDASIILAFYSFLSTGGSGTLEMYLDAA